MEKYIKATGKTIKKKALVYKKEMGIIIIRVIGPKTKRMEKELCGLLMDLNMKEDSDLITHMDSEYFKII